MIWRDHVFNYGPKSAIRETKFREKNGESLNFITLGAEFEGHNWKHDLARLCFMLCAQSFKKIREHVVMIMSYNLQISRQLMRLGGAYNFETTTAPLFADMIQRKPACKIRSEGLYHSDATIFLKQNSSKPQRRPPDDWKVYRQYLCITLLKREPRRAQK